MQRGSTELTQLLDELRNRLACQKLFLLEYQLELELRAGFDPDQPRDELGRWTETGDEGGGGDDRQYTVDLKEEEALGGHTLRRHVGKSDEELTNFLGVLKWRGFFTTTFWRAIESFDSIESANDYVNRLLESDKATVDLVAKGKLDGAWISQRFGYVTGKEAFREQPDNEPYIRRTFSAGVRILHDSRSSRGYRVQTAYPFNQDTKGVR